jgi:hypothetical protein
MLTRRFRGWRGRRGALLAPCLISLALCAGCGAVHAVSHIGPARPLVIATDSAPNAATAPLYTAAANGDFAAGALSVVFTQSGSGPAALAAVSSGSAQVAIATEPQLLQARDGGASLVAIGVLEQTPLEAFTAGGSPTLSSPSQLAGRTVASDGSALAAAELDTVLDRAGISRSSVTTVTVTSNLDAWLESHRNAVTLGSYWNLDPLLLARAGLRPSTLQLTNDGIPAFSDQVIVVRMGEAHYDGPLLRAFLQSITRGEIAVVADPDSAANTLVRLNAQVPKAIELASLRQSATVAEPANTNNPFGYQSQAQWQTFGNWMTAHGLLRHTANAGYAITDEFLPGEGE